MLVGDQVQWGKEICLGSWSRIADEVLGRILGFWVDFDGFGVILMVFG